MANSLWAALSGGLSGVGDLGRMLIGRDEAAQKRADLLSQQGIENSQRSRQLDLTAENNQLLRTMQMLEFMSRDEARQSEAQAREHATVKDILSRLTPTTPIDPAVAARIGRTPFKSELMQEVGAPMPTDKPQTLPGGLQLPAVNGFSDIGTTPTSYRRFNTTEQAAMDQAGGIRELPGDFNPDKLNALATMIERSLKPEDPSSVMSALKEASAGGDLTLPERYMETFSMPDQQAASRMRAQLSESMQAGAPPTYLQTSTGWQIGGGGGAGRGVVTPVRTPVDTPDGRQLTPVGSPLSAGQETGLAALRSGAGAALKALELGRETKWEGVGPIEGPIQQFMFEKFGHGSSKAATLRNIINNIFAEGAHEKYGSALTPTEQSILQTILSRPNNSPEQLEANLTEYINFLREKEQNLLKATVSNLAGTIQGAPEPAYDLSRR